MSELPPKDPKQEPLDYEDTKARKSSGLGVGCFVMSILLACAVGGLSTLAFLIMMGDRPDFAMILAVGVVVLIVAAIVARRYGMSAAVAMTSASLGVLLLMSGGCSRFTVRF